MFLYDFKCPEHGLFEAFSTLTSRDKEKPCPVCERATRRVQTPIRFKLEGLSGHFPTAADKWASVHEREAKREPV